MYYAWLDMLFKVTYEIDGHCRFLSLFTQLTCYLACFKLDILDHEKLRAQDTLRREVIYYATEHKRLGHAKA
ncbi:hypothetical protein ES705_39873 [subsurface metagenome]